MDGCAHEMIHAFNAILMSIVRFVYKGEYVIFKENKKERISEVFPFVISIVVFNEQKEKRKKKNK